MFRSSSYCIVCSIIRLPYSNTIQRFRYFIYLDFQKAFDKVPHKRLLKKLHAYGIRGQVYEWIKEFLNKRQQRVTINGSKSDWRNVTSGIPQGSVLGPVLFLVFINDFPDVIEVLLKLFADDAKVYNIISSLNDVQPLQRSVNNAGVWSIDWEMLFNIKKCHQLHVGHNETGYTYTMQTHYGTHPIEKVANEKDLGVIIDSKLTFRDHITSKINLANRNLGIIFRTFTFLDTEIFLTLYKSLVRPHLEYATVVWSPLYKKDRIAIENVQRRATRLVRACKNLSYPERLRKLGLPTLEYRRQRADMVQVYKILNDIDKVDKAKLFSMATYNRTRGHPLKLFKERPRLNVRANSFSNRVTNTWNQLPEDIVMAPSLNAFKGRLNKYWSSHPYKFTASCYEPGTTTGFTMNYNQNAPSEVS